MNFTVCTYTHSKCFDIFDYYLKRLNKYFPNSNNITFSNLPISDDNILYNEEEPYSLHYIKCLETISSDYIIYMQEDYILYSNVNETWLSNAIEYMKSSNLDYIRLIKTDDCQTNVVDENLCLYKSPNEFSMQPTIWKKESLIDIIKRSNINMIFDEPLVTQFMGHLNGCYYYNGENKRGLAHYDTKVFPYIATALIKGKLNFREYRNELNEFIDEYSIKFNREIYE